LKIQVIHGSKIAERMIIDYRIKENRMKTSKDIYDIFLNMEWKIAPIRNEKDEITHYLAIQREVS
jgi:hypothetical protein